MWMASYIILAEQTEKRINEIKAAISKKFEIKDIDELNYFLGIKVEQRDNDSHGILYSTDDLDSIIGFTDADWVDDCKSTSGCFFILSGGVVSWSWKSHTHRKKLLKE